jgi:hypothetical protein
MKKSVPILPRGKRVNSMRSIKKYTLFENFHIFISFLCVASLSAYLDY